MSDVAPEVKVRRYKAFLSYSHQDSAAGDWLHRSIEGYLVPMDLIGRQTRLGPVPAKLRPIFRDRFDLSASPSLHAMVEQALIESDSLLVLCSIASAKSPYVDTEIRRFKALGRGDRIFPLILDGEPHDPEQECFPAALQFKVDGAGSLTNERDIEPIAADARAHADGRDLARLKIIAGLLGVGLDEIRKREIVAERARRRMWMGLAGVMTGLAMAASFAAVIAVLRTKDAERRFDLAYKAAVTQVQRVDALQDQMGVSEPVLAGLMGDALDQLDKLTTETGAESDSFRFNRAEAQLLAADLARRRGQSAEQLRRINDAIAALQPLGARDTDNTNGWRGQLAAAYDRRGDALKETGQTGPAEADFKNSRAIFEQIGMRAGATQKDIAMLATAYSMAADRMTAASQVDEQLDMLTKALELRRKLVETMPDDTELQRSFGISMISVAKTTAFRNGASDSDRANAETLSSEAINLFARLSGKAPRDSDLAHTLGNAYSGRGDVRIALNRLADARMDYVSDLALAKADAENNPQNARSQLDYAVSLGRVGLTDINLGKSAVGIARLREALEVEAHVAARDWANAAFQDLAVKRTVQIATQLKAAGDAEDAVEAYRQAIKLRDAAAAGLPTRGAYVVDRIGQRLLFSRFLEAVGRKGEAIRALEDARDIAVAKTSAFDTTTIERISELKAKLDGDITARR